MADTRPPSFLPAVKCSDCGAEIEISRMGDHVCLGAIAIPESTVPKSKSFFDRAANFSNSMKLGVQSPGFLKPGRPTPPSHIDSSAANLPYLDVEPMTANSTQTTSGEPSPLTPLTPASRAPSRQHGQPSLSPMPFLDPLPSPDMHLNLDSAFPPFPTGRPGTSGENRPKMTLQVQTNMDGDHRWAPLSPSFNGSTSVLERMNTIAPGPFDARAKQFAAKAESPIEKKPEPMHKRSGTLSSLRSLSRSSDRSTHSRKASHHSRPSTSGSEKSRTSTRSREPSIPEVTKAKPGPPPRPARSDDVDTFLQELQEEAVKPTMSTSLPLRQPSNGSANKDAISRPRVPSEPASQHPPSLSIISRPATAPEPPVGHGYEQEPLPEVKSLSFSKRTSSRKDVRTDTRLADAPPVPTAPRLDTTNLLGHSSSDSASSQENAGFDGRSASSRSTPPTSAGSSPTMEYLNKPLPSITDAVTRPRAESRPDGPSSALRALTSAAAPSSPERIASANRPHIPEPIALPKIPVVAEGPESPLDPAINTARLQPERPVDPRALPNIQTVVSAPLPPLPNEVVEASPVTPSTPRKRSHSTSRKPAVSKGNCRGCGEAIFGKSVKAADGRLTGRYHKECFNCRTCRAPFPTADFYVMDNFPYCHHHYHQLNNSLCRYCNRGIEGQYLETERHQKFHPRCFGCDTCRIPLRSDYFDVGGTVYCERHAFHAARQTSHLGPGRRHPERRTTRLMMM
ncbi:hypothetical protein K490DRAFT_65084 [Saccharata proteae CBS 121410]|uniref:LIM zinc-binding domain-containing protein n=1 Tax=Saccharata proteae CBS 121410 TaxID=1314787 RepID=A0A9P4HTM5_9PEZI|nr:hypothetical protein K490DRAFT_65084 [Saccharata proteae CBS 121410]